MHGGGPAFPFVWGGDLIGARIRLFNIASRPELNGSFGRIVAAIAASKRFRVRLEDKSEMSVTRSKLLRLSDGGWGDEHLGKNVVVNGLVKAAHLNGSQVCHVHCVLPVKWCVASQLKALDSSSLQMMFPQGFVIGADASSQRLVVAFKSEGEEEGKEIALKPENVAFS